MGIPYHSPYTGPQVDKAVGRINDAGISTKEFQIVGDGSDETNKIQQAIDAAISLGQRLIFPEGEFGYTYLSISGALYLVGAGMGKTIFKALEQMEDQTDGSIEIQTESSVFMEGFTIDGDDEVQRGLKIYAETTTTLHEVEVKNIYGDVSITATVAAIMAGGGGDLRFINCLIKDVTAEPDGDSTGNTPGTCRGIHLTRLGAEGVHSALIQGCTFRNILSGTLVTQRNEDADAIAFQSFPQDMVSKVLVENNHFYNIGKRWMKILSPGVTFTGNDGTNDSPSTKPMYSIVSANSSNIVITNNQCSGGAVGYFCDVGNPNTWACSNIIVSKNIHTQSATDPHTSGKGCRTMGAAGSLCTGVVITENHFMTVQIGVQVAGGSVGVTVGRNRIVATETGVHVHNRHSGEDALPGPSHIEVGENIGTATTYGVRWRAGVTDSTCGFNIIDADDPLICEGDPVVVFKNVESFNLQIIGGSIKGLTPPFVVGSSTAGTFGADTPEVQAVDTASSGGVASMLIETRDGTRNRRVRFALQDGANPALNQKWGLEQSQSSGGGVPFYVGIGGTIRSWIDTSGRHFFSDPTTDSTAPSVSEGTGTPEGVRAAPPGSWFIQRDGTNGRIFWRKEIGTGNTGWSISVDKSDIKDWGAKGDGTTDDTTAIQNAISGSVGKLLFWSKGIYKITATLVVPPNITIIGSGCTTNSNGCTILRHFSSGPTIQSTGRSISMRGFRVQANTGFEGTGVGMLIEDGTRSYYSEIEVFHHYDAWVLERTYCCTFDLIGSYKPYRHGIVLGTTLPNQSNSNRIFLGHLHGYDGAVVSGSHGIEASYGRANEISAGEIRYFDYPVYDLAVQNQYRATWLELNSNGYYIEQEAFAQTYGNDSRSVTYANSESRLIGENSHYFCKRYRRWDWASGMTDQFTFSERSLLTTNVHNSAATGSANGVMSGTFTRTEAGPIGGRMRATYPAGYLDLTSAFTLTAPFTIAIYFRLRTALGDGPRGYLIRWAGASIATESLGIALPTAEGNQYLTLMSGNSTVIKNGGAAPINTGEWAWAVLYIDPVGGTGKFLDPIWGTESQDFTFTNPVGALASVRLPRRDGADVDVEYGAIFRWNRELTIGEVRSLQEEFPQQRQYDIEDRAGVKNSRTGVLSFVSGNVTLIPGVDPTVQVCTEVLTANRIVTLDTTPAHLGDLFEVYRTTASTGSFTLTVAGLPLGIGQFAAFYYDGAAWQIRHCGPIVSGGGSDLLLTSAIQGGFAAAPYYIYGRGSIRWRYLAGSGLKFETGFGGNTGDPYTFSIDSVDQAQIDKSATAGHTRFLIYDVNSALLQRVKVGANGTGPGGVGRALYLDNV